MTADEYIALLQARRTQHLTERTMIDGARDWITAPPPLEMFVLPGDERLFTPPTRTRESTQRVSRPARRPRRYVPSTELQARRERLQARLDAVAGYSLPERAAATGVGVGPRAARRHYARIDATIDAVNELTAKLARLDARIRAAKRWEEAQQP